MGCGFVSWRKCKSPPPTCAYRSWSQARPGGRAVQERWISRTSLSICDVDVASSCRFRVNGRRRSLRTWVTRSEQLVSSEWHWFVAFARRQLYPWRRLSITNLRVRHRYTSRVTLTQRRIVFAGLQCLPWRGFSVYVLRPMLKGPQSGETEDLQSFYRPQNLDNISGNLISSGKNRNISEKLVLDQAILKALSI